MRHASITPSQPHTTSVAEWHQRLTAHCEISWWHVQGVDVSEVGPEGVDEAAVQSELAAAAPLVLEQARGISSAVLQNAGEVPECLQGIGR